MGNIKFFDLPFYEELFYLSEAMQYSVSDYHKLTSNSSAYQIKNHQYWIEQINKCLDKGTYLQVIGFKTQNEREINENPLLAGILNMYEKAFFAKDEAEYKQVYEEYQTVQRNHPFEKNMEDYINMGCMLMTGYLEDTGKIMIAYPLPLYTSYTMNGGKDDDYRGGYLYPTHELTHEQVFELHETHPELFKSEKVKAAYEKIAQAKKPSQPGE